MFKHVNFKEDYYVFEFTRMVITYRTEMLRAKSSFNLQSLNPDEIPKQTRIV